MANYVFSPSENAFYLVALKHDYLSAGTWPKDGLSVDDDLAIFMGEAPEGKIRGVDDSGLPCWVNTPPPSHEEQLAVANLEKQSRIAQANDYMNSKQWPGKAVLGRLKGDELVQYNIWLDYLEALEVVDASGASDITWPETPAT